MIAAAMPAYSIGVDLGGTNLRAAAISRDGEMIDKISGATELRAGREAVIADIVDSIRTVRAKAGEKAKLAGVGIGVPGFIDIEKGLVVGSNNLPGFEGFPVRDEIEHLLGTPVLLENDANAAAMGEKWIGAGRDVNDLILLTLGTGIGGGIIARGRIVHGFLGMAGEFGHMTVIPNGNPCGCGNYGCLEKHASATAIAGTARMLGLGAEVTSEEVYHLAEDGNERAKMCFRAMGEALGIALGNLINGFNFPLYLLSGGVLAAWDLFAPPMMEQIRLRSFTFRNTTTRVEKAILGSEAGLYGAAYLPFIHRKMDA
jgi:glucokinase